MRYIKYLNENLDRYFMNNEVFDLASNNKLYLYRGTYNNINPYQIINRRTDRKPKDMPKQLHYDLDEAFKKKFGWKARSTGVFTTGEKMNAEEHGDAYIFIPIKPYKILWSPKIFDLFTVIDGHGRFLKKAERKILLRYDEMEASDDEHEDYMEIIDKLINTYTDKNIKQAILSKNEIIFDCNSYILFDEEYFWRNYN